MKKTFILTSFDLMALLLSLIHMDTKGKKMQKDAGKMLADANKLNKQSEQMRQTAGKLLSDGNKIEKTKKKEAKVAISNKK